MGCCGSSEKGKPEPIPSSNITTLKREEEKKNEEPKPTPPKPVKHDVDGKTFKSHLFELTTLTESSLDALAKWKQPFQLFEALAAYLNAIYSYLLEVQKSIADDVEGLLEEKVKELKNDLKELEKALNPEDEVDEESFYQKVQKTLVSSHLNLKSTQQQLEQFSHLSSHPLLHFILSQEFNDLYQGCRYNPSYLSNEIQQILKEKSHSSNLKCGKCQSPLKYYENIQDLMPGASEGIHTFNCDKCGHVCKASSGFWGCACNYTICKVCDSLGLFVKCGRCQEKLQYCTDLPKYNSGDFICNICSGRREIESGVHHCFKDDWDVCVDCRSNYHAEHFLLMRIESERLWKNVWIKCPILPGERGALIDENQQAANFEVEGKVDWEDEWHGLKDEVTWEYAICWGGIFGSNSEGCFVRRKMYLKNREKLHS